MLLYFGAEVLMPVVSAVAAALGVVLAGGKRLLSWIHTGLRWIGRLVGVDDTHDSEDVRGEGSGPPDGDDP